MHRHLSGAYRAGSSGWAGAGDATVRSNPIATAERRDMTAPVNEQRSDRTSITERRVFGERRDIALAPRPPAGLESCAFPTNKEVPGHEHHHSVDRSDPSPDTGDRRRGGPRGGRGTAR